MDAPSSTEKGGPPPSEHELLLSHPSSILGRPAYSTMPSPHHQRGNFHGTHNREPADHRRPSNCAKHTRKNDKLSFLPAFRRSLRRESQPGSDSGPDQYNQPLRDLTIPPPEAQILDETAPARSAISKKEPQWKTVQVILNPYAGRGRGAKMAGEIEAAFRRHNVSCEIAATSAPGGSRLSGSPRAAGRLRHRGCRRRRRNRS